MNELKWRPKFKHSQRNLDNTWLHLLKSQALKTMKNISLDITKAEQFLKANAVAAYESKVKAAQASLENGTCPGNDFLGWLHLPSSITDAFLNVA